MNNDERARAWFWDVQNLKTNEDVVNLICCVVRAKGEEDASYVEATGRGDARCREQAASLRAFAADIPELPLNAPATMMRSMTAEEAAAYHAFTKKISRRVGLLGRRETEYHREGCWKLSPIDEGDPCTCGGPPRCQRS